MLVAILQLLLLPLAGIALFRIWRRVSSTGKGVALVVTAGFLIRAFLGQLLFWLSYLPIRFPAGVEDDNGLWFFAWDGRAYFLAAADTSHQGWSAILHYPSGAAAAFFVKILAVLVTLFGSVASVGLLLNAFAYLGTCAAMVSLFPRDSRTTTIALAALSFYPSVILWSLQPLKDTFFLALVAGFVALAFAWQQLWKQTGGRYRFLKGIAIFAGAVVLIYGMAGIRWYFAAVFLVGAIPFLLLAAIRARSWMSAFASLLLFATSVWAFYMGGGAYIPDALLALVKSDKPATAATQLPRTLIAGVVDIRDGFRRTPGNTDIVDAQTAPATPVATPPKKRKRKPAPRPAVATTTTAVAETAPPPAMPTTTEPAAAPTTTEQVAATTTTAETVPVVHTQTTSAPAPGPEPVPEPTQEAEAEPPTPTPAPMKKAEPAPPVPAPATTIAPAPAPAPTPAPAVTPEPAPAGADGALLSAVKGGSLSVPVKQALVGMSAMILPRFVGETLGLYRIASNSRMFLFAELDTLYFDAVLVFAFLALFRSFRRGGWRSPALLLVVITTGTMAGMLAYTITNFGTLFRHRGMVFIGLVMIPLIVAGEVARRNAVPADEAAESGD